MNVTATVTHADIGQRDMERKPVTSSNILSVGHDPLTQELEVEFKGGGLYRYVDVPAETYAEFILSESPGRYFAQHIKPNYECRKVVMLPVLVAGEPCEGGAP